MSTNLLLTHLNLLKLCAMKHSKRAELFLECLKNKAEGQSVAGHSFFKTVMT